MYKTYVKRIIDILIALICLPFFLLIYIIIGPIIYCEDHGPIFYLAERVGKDKNIFKMYKFRSMKVNSPDIRNKDGSTYNSKDDPRVTRIGKIIRRLSIDETAQILNVLKGDMSIIGPRPATTMILKEMTSLQEARFTVKPGITGYTQVLYRNSAQGEKRYKADKYYADNVSLLLDIKIIFGTIARVIKGKDLYSNKK